MCMLMLSGCDVIDAFVEGENAKSQARVLQAQAQADEAEANKLRAEAASAAASSSQLAALTPMVLGFFLVVVVVVLLLVPRTQHYTPYNFEVPPEHYRVYGGREWIWLEDHRQWVPLERRLEGPRERR